MDFVDFDLAKKLKEKGFREKVNAYYGKHENIFEVHPALDMNDNDYRCSAPTISQVLKWLREVHNVYVDIGIYVITKYMLKYNINVYHNKNRKDSMYSGIHLTKECSKYEEACEVALKYTLDNLI